MTHKIKVRDLFNVTKEEVVRMYQQRTVRFYPVFVLYAVTIIFLIKLFYVVMY